MNSPWRSHTWKNYLTFSEIHKGGVTSSMLFKTFCKVFWLSNFENRSRRASGRRDARDIGSEKSEKLRKLGNACFYLSSYILCVDKIRRGPKFPEDFQASELRRFHKNFSHRIYLRQFGHKYIMNYLQIFPNHFSRLCR